MTPSQRIAQLPTPSLTLRRLKRHKAALASLSLALLMAACAPLQRQAITAPPPAEVAAAQSRWQPELQAFAAADRTIAPGGVVAVGSSTVRFWTTLPKDFPWVPGGVVNRGFGGSTLHDCSLLVEPLVLRLAPRHVLLYAGDNDLAEGRTPQQVLEDLQRFVRAVRAELPATRISYISIKPSPSRETLLPAMREANAAIAAWLKTVPNTDFIDVFNPMLDANGRPRPALFLPDQLHMTAEGYRLWQQVVAPYLGAP
ncbi:SGNH/GDSL hydrolase family protein [Variovorax sp. Sphag1AA]|uniref:SGNH/GDSL hydrolase family protein n=1 Tax=Variovorax sp. Sphag1AA TaxID=2587027 RepID=UPI0016171FFD|nr:SGNH/GDSL hydrolase family protein [Variovorax sp. Sphag1AA]MBB3179470.1 lysophospholipase L1-like esterase [Variovorax sp. Sphag1AA]